MFEKYNCNKNLHLFSTAKCYRISKHNHVRLEINRCIYHINCYKIFSLSTAKRTFIGAYIKTRLYFTFELPYTYLVFIAKRASYFVLFLRTGLLQGYSFLFFCKTKASEKRSHTNIQLFVYVSIYG